MMLAAVETVTKADPVWESRRHNSDIAAQATAGESLHSASPLQSPFGKYTVTDVGPSPAAACGLPAIWRSMAIMERVTGIGGVFQRAGQAASLRDWYAEHLGIDISDWGGKPFDWTPGGSTTWAIFDHDTEYFGRPEQAFMVNFRVADLDAMLAQLRSAGVEVIDALEESEYGRFGWAVDPEGTRFEIWEPPPGR
jgi:predicted enzyme related to lactoylglutathione lyase